MGNCVSAPAEEREAKMRSSMIDKELRSAARDYGNTIKILLLGKPRLLLFCSVTYRRRQQEDAFDLLSISIYSRLMLLKITIPNKRVFVIRNSTSSMQLM